MKVNDLELDKDRAETLFMMLKSPDQNSRSLAFEILNQLDLNLGLGYFLTLFKFTPTTHGEWVESGILDKLPKLKESFRMKVFKNDFKNYADELRKLVVDHGDDDALEYFDEKSRFYFAHIEKTLSGLSIVNSNNVTYDKE